jgi:glycosyltransferase involved in cell wall biosynthesis
MDYPNHYRDVFFEKLSKLIDFRLVLTSREGSDRRGLRHAFSDDVHVSYLGDWGYERVIKSVWRSLVIFLRAWFAVVRLRPGVLIVFGYRNPACWIAPFARVLLRSRVVIWGESNYFDKPRSLWRESLKRLFVLFAEQAHAYGSNGRDYYLYLGVPPDRIYITQPTVLEDKFRSVARREDTHSGHVRLLYVGRFEPVKNLFYLLAGLSDLSSNAGASPSLTMVGFGSQEQDLRRYCTENNLESQVAWLGKLQQDDVANVMTGHDVLILPSTCEPYGLVVLEAMHAGLAVIVSKRCGCAKDLIREDTGWLIDPLDRACLVRTLREIVRIGRRRVNSVGRSAQQFAERYSSVRSAELTAEALRELAHR